MAEQQKPWIDRYGPRISYFVHGCAALGILYTTLSWLWTWGSQYLPMIPSFILFAIKLGTLGGMLMLCVFAGGAWYLVARNRRICLDDEFVGLISFAAIACWFCGIGYAHDLMVEEVVPTTLTGWISLVSLVAAVLYSILTVFCWRLRMQWFSFVLHSCVLELLRIGGASADMQKIKRATKPTWSDRPFRNLLNDLQVTELMSAIDHSDNGPQGAELGSENIARPPAPIDPPEVV